MKYLVVSDIHGSLYYARKLEEIINKENPDKIILLFNSNLKRKSKCLKVK